MISFIIIIVPLMIYCTWIFFKKSPSSKSSYLSLYNFIAFSLVVVLSVYLGYIGYNKTVNSIDFGWAPFTAFISASISFLTGIVLIFLIRILFFKKNGG